MIWEDLQAMLLLPEFVIQIAAAHSSVFPFYLDYCLVLSFCNAMSSVSISKLVETKVSHQRSLSPTKSDTCKLFFKAKQSSSFYPDSFVCLLSVLFFFSQFQIRIFSWRRCVSGEWLPWWSTSRFCYGAHGSGNIQSFPLVTLHPLGVSLQTTVF